MKVTIAADTGEVYETFEVDRRDTRLGWLLIDSDGYPLRVDWALEAAASWAERTTGEVVQR